MSLLWGYDSAKCDGEWCPNDCDHCYKADLEVRTLAVLERVSQSRATPIADCLYPECEKCDKYHAHYCTVPIVVSKQIYRETMERIGKLEKSLSELESLVTDETFAFSQAKQMQIESLMFNVSELKEEICKLKDYIRGHIDHAILDI